MPNIWKKSIEINEPEQFASLIKAFDENKPLAPHGRGLIKYLNENFPNYIPSEQATRYAHLVENYIQLYKQQKSVLKEFENDLDLIIDMQMPDSFKEGEWIHSIEGNNIKDWAAANNVDFQSPENNILSPNQQLLRFEYHALKGNTEEALALITAQNIEITDAHGNTPLLCALNCENESLIEALIERKADVNCNENSGGYTPLLFALDKENTKLVTILLENGAECNYLNKDKISPLSLAVNRDNKKWGCPR